MSLDFQWDSNQIPHIPRAADPREAALQLRDDTPDYVLSMVRPHGIDVTRDDVVGMLNGGVSRSLAARIGEHAMVLMESAVDAVAWLVDSVQTGVFVLDSDTVKLCNWMLVGAVDDTAGILNLEHDTEDATEEDDEDVQLSMVAREEYLSKGFADLDEVPRADERALALAAFLIRAHCFRTGNTRTARHMASGYLMSHGYHHLTPRIQNRGDFNHAVHELLVNQDATHLMILMAQGWSETTDTE